MLKKELIYVLIASSFCIRSINRSALLQSSEQRTIQHWLCCVDCPCMVTNLDNWIWVPQPHDITFWHDWRPLTTTKASSKCSHWKHSRGSLNISRPQTQEISWAPAKARENPGFRWDRNWGDVMWAPPCRWPSSCMLDQPAQHIMQYLQLESQKSTIQFHKSMQESFALKSSASSSPGCNWSLFSSSSPQLVGLWLPLETGQQLTCNSLLTKERLKLLGTNTWKAERCYPQASP